MAPLNPSSSCLFKGLLQKNKINKTTGTPHKDFPFFFFFFFVKAKSIFGFLLVYETNTNVDLLWKWSGVKQAFENRPPVFQIWLMNYLAGKPLEVKTLMNASVANINVSVLLGKQFDYQDIPFLRLLTLTDPVWKSLSVLQLPYLYPSYSLLLPPMCPWLFSRDHEKVLIRESPFQNIHFLKHWVLTCLVKRSDQSPITESCIKYSMM